MMIPTAITIAGGGFKAMTIGMGFMRAFHDAGTYDERKKQISKIKRLSVMRKLSFAKKKDNSHSLCLCKIFRYSSSGDAHGGC